MAYHVAQVRDGEDTLITVVGENQAQALAKLAAEANSGREPEDGVSPVVVADVVQYYIGLGFTVWQGPAL